ncbi:hypothetical protein [Paenibacillus caui]|uniref:hypothetical protein n=1 Tax=Paenibacillus caui TaxID=2873927 RepID=UPI0030805F76
MNDIKEQYSITEMTIDDYEGAYRLWKNTKGMGLSAADSRESIASYLQRNEGLSFVCKQDGQIVGTVLCGHDGRRGFMYPLRLTKNTAVKPLPGHLWTGACPSCGSRESASAI